MEATGTLATAVEAVDDDNDDDGLESQSRPVYRIAFEEYLRAWLKTASTKAGVLMGREALDELIKCPERFAARYGIPGSGSDVLNQDQRQIFRGITCGPGRRRLKTHSERKRARVNQMRKIYQLCRSPELLNLQVPAHKDSVSDPETKECWESEVDKLVAWTHSLSFEELDRQCHGVMESGEDDQGAD